jgi:hypothetical protein
MRALAEDLRIGMEAHARAAPVGDAADRLQRPLRQAAREGLAIEHLAARDLDLEPVGQRIDHGDADAVQAARGLVGLGVELSAGMQRRHDDFERRLAREFRMRIDRDAAAVIGDGDRAVLEQFDIDEAGVARHRLVHGVVDHLGEEVVQRAFVGAADIHARPAPHRLQAFEDLDGRGVVAGLGECAVAWRRRQGDGAGLGAGTAGGRASGSRA